FPSLSTTIFTTTLPSSFVSFGKVGGLINERPVKLYFIPPPFPGPLPGPFPGPSPVPLPPPVPPPVPPVPLPLGFPSGAPCCPASALLPTPPPVLPDSFLNFSANFSAAVFSFTTGLITTVL